jgi:hypothetical protein
MINLNWKMVQNLFNGVWSLQRQHVMVCFMQHYNALYEIWILEWYWYGIGVIDGVFIAYSSVLSPISTFILYN